MQSKNIKRCKIERSTKCCLRILIFFDFETQNPNFDLSKIEAYKIQNFGVTKKHGIYVVKLPANNTHTKFKSNIFLAMQWPKERVKVMSLFEMKLWHF